MFVYVYVCVCGSSSAGLLKHALSIPFSNANACVLLCVCMHVCACAGVCGCVCAFLYIDRMKPPPLGRIFFVVGSNPRAERKRF